jgi:hypothetical protein
MKTIFYIPIFLLSGIPGILQAQHVLQSNLNLPRPGDEIVKQQVEYKDPGRSGENVLWDFGRLKTINDEYTLAYSEPEPAEDSGSESDTIASQNLIEGSLLIGTEHNTMYYYYLTDNRLWTLGHENPTTLLQYTRPLIAGVYPMYYQDSCRYDYQSEGLYSSSIPFATDGEAQIRADACGMMILPSGDTLRNVLRTHAIQTIRQVFRSVDSETVEQRSLVETFKWYSKGYRYPVFETVRTAIVTDATETVNFETAFFFPPQDHYYLDDDLENSALQEEETGAVPDPWEGLTYNYFPNPVQYTPLEVEICLPVPADIRVQLRSTMGLLKIDEHKGIFPVGICRFRVETYALTPGNYILDIWLNEKLIGGIILKR